MVEVVGNEIIFVSSNKTRLEIILQPRCTSVSHALVIIHFTLSTRERKYVVKIPRPSSLSHECSRLCVILARKSFPTGATMKRNLFASSNCDKMEENWKTSLSKYKHGLAYVSNVDGRGIFSVNSIFKRGEKSPKTSPVYDFVNILCYVGGEIRDGFLMERLRETELTSILEAHFQLVRERAFFQPTAVEDAAKLLILPCQEKADKTKGNRFFANNDVRRSFEFYEHVSKFCAYDNDKVFIQAKGANAIKKGFSHLDLRRPEFNAWWIQKSELESLGCESPPLPTNFPEPGQLLEGGETMVDFISETNRQRLKMSAWRKKIAEKLSTPSNIEKLSGMARHQALFYVWKGDLKIGITMFEAAKQIEDHWKAARRLDVRNPILDLILNMTHVKLARLGECEGQTVKVNWGLSRQQNCAICLAPAKEDIGGQPCDGFTLTCVEANGKGRIGTESTRRTLATALAIVRSIGNIGGFKSAIEYSLRDSLDVFLEHSFVNLCWDNKPTPPMKEFLLEEAVTKFMNELISVKFDCDLWAESCTKILQELMVKHCGQKMSDKDVAKTEELFREGFISQIVQSVEKTGKEPEYISVCNNKDALYQFCSVMTAISVAPSVSSRFVLNWKTMSYSEKKNTLSAVFEDLLSAARKVYECCTKGLPACHWQKTNPKQGSKSGCECQDVAKFQDHVWELLSSNSNPVSFLRASSEDGTVTLSEGLFEDDSVELISDMISCRDMYVYEEIVGDGYWREFAWCPRLVGLTKFALVEVYTMLKLKIVEGFKERTKQDYYWLEMHSCACCGHTGVEGNALKKCSACMAVVYCSSECQKKHWKAGHKQRCQTLRRS